MIRESHILLFSIFIAGLCSIIYELLIATTGAYFLGDSITQFSLTIGIYMAFMGVGSYLSRWVSDTKLLGSFIGFELILALIGGMSVPILYFSYAFDLPLQLSSVVLTAMIGVLIGLEIPLLSRLMEKHYNLKTNISNVLSIDYFGALLATLLFPFLLLPWLGVFKTSLAFGMMNLTIALALLWYFAEHLSIARKNVLRLALTLVSLILVGTFIFSNELNKIWNNRVYEDHVVHSEQSQYQQLVLTRSKNDIRLYLNGGLQFSSIDEYRYHEALVHPAMARLHQPKQVLLLGGADGLAVRELLKYDSIEQVTLVDLDPAVAKLARENHYVKALNQDSLNSTKVDVIHQDGFVYSAEDKKEYDLILIDLPDPKTISLARLYSKQFYQQLKRRLHPHGLMVTQATSPFFARDAFWSIHNTAVAAGFNRVAPYRVNVPSFGEWGFIMACKHICQQPVNHDIESRFYKTELEAMLFTIPPDFENQQQDITTLDNPSVLYYYLKGWKYWN